MSLVEVAPPPSPVAIVGSRKYPSLGAVRDFVGSLPRDAQVVSGGAPGVDTVAELAATERGLYVRSYRPQKDDLGRWRIVEWNYQEGRQGVIWLKGTYATFAKAAHTRNQMIVNAAGSVAAFWDGQSTGTLSTIEKAEAAGILYQVFTDQEDSKDG